MTEAAAWARPVDEVAVWAPPRDAVEAAVALHAGVQAESAVAEAVPHAVVRVVDAVEAAPRGV